MPRAANRHHGLVVLEGVIVEQARIALELRNPQYVDAFRAALSDDPEVAMVAAQPHLGRRPWWYDLLTGLLSVELAMDQARHALLLMSSHRGAGAEDGRLLNYHVDHWTFQMHALLEKSDHLIKRVYRTLVKRLHPDTDDEKLRQTTAALDELRREYAKVRNPLVHPRGGSVTAVEEDRLWEAHVLVGATAAHVIAGYNDGLPRMRPRWHAQRRQLTAVALQTLDVAFTQAAQDATTASRLSRRR